MSSKSNSATPHHPRGRSRLRVRRPALYAICPIDARQEMFYSRQAAGARGREVRGQKSEVRGQTSDGRALISELFAKQRYDQSRRGERSEVGRARALTSDL